MNWRGELLELIAEASNSQDSKKPKEKATKTDQALVLQNVRGPTEFIYTGDFMCWKAAEDKAVKFVRVRDKEDVGQGG